MTTQDRSSSSNPSVGWVALVGAGPGDPELLTLKGRRYLEGADVVFYDRLVDRRLLGHTRKDAELVNVGKRPGGPRDWQAEINSLLIDRARDGKSVVRLKGGDPFIFGRGGEEVAALAEAGIPFEVVPGITSAIGAPTYAGIPLTHRGVSSSVTIVTGSKSPDQAESAVDWDLLAKSEGTLSLLMGWENLPVIVQALIDGGRAEDTPAAVVQWGTWANQQTVVGTLGSIADTTRDAGLSNPVVVVIGEVVNLREVSRWFDNRPLFGKRILVTRSRTQSADLVELFERVGAEPVEVPTIEIQPVDDKRDIDAELARLAEYEWVVFTSTNTVEQFFRRVDAMGLDARLFHDLRVAAIGKATGTALRERGIVADLVSRESVSQSLIEGLGELGVSGQHILLPGAAVRPDRLKRGLDGLGAIVREVTTYSTVLPSGSGKRLAEALESGVDVVTFTSSSTVTNLMALLDGDVSGLWGARVACIGPVTAETAKRAGLNVDIVAGESTAGGLVDAIVAHYMSEGSDE